MATDGESDLGKMLAAYNFTLFNVVNDTKTNNLGQNALYTDGFSVVSEKKLSKRHINSPFSSIHFFFMCFLLGNTEQPSIAEIRNPLHTLKVA